MDARGTEVSGIRKISLMNATEHMVLARDIVNAQDTVLVTAGTALRREILALLHKHEIASVWVEAPAHQNQEISVVPSLIGAATRIRMVQAMQNAFRHRSGIALHLPFLRQCIHEVIQELARRDYLLIYLTDIRQKQDYLYGHCVDVGVLAVALGMAMGLPREEVYVLGIGGLLHDYGKIVVDNAILEKNGPLTPDEFEQVKRHAAVGYNILRTETKVDSRIALMALQHHERVDGRGYPWMTARDEIHPLARIVAVADVYDALITDRVYRPRITAHEAVKIVNAGSGTQFDPEVVAAFNRITVPYYIGSAVQLDNGVAGAVLRINSSNPARPVVWTRQGIVNLLYEPERKIVAVV